MGRAVIGIFTVVALLATGCLSSGYEDAPFLAGERVDDTDWIDMDNPDRLELLAVVGLEAADADEIVFPRLDAYLAERAQGIRDPVIGDGRAPLWLYVYRTEDVGDRQYVVVHQSLGDKDVTFAPSLVGISPYLDELDGSGVIDADWMDSDQAARQAEELAPDWPTTVEESGNVVMLLHQPAHLEHPVWGFAFHPTGGGGPVSALFDASVGASANPLMLDDVFPSPRPAGSTEDVMLTPAGNGAVSLEVGREYTGLELKIEPADSPNPAAHVHAWLYDPDGNDAGLDDSSWPEPIVHGVQAAAQGTWTLEMGAFSDSDAAALTENVRVTWCADGGGKDPLGVRPAAGDCL